MRVVILAIVAGALCTQFSASADKKETPKTTAKLMAEKLKNSQLVLEGLAMNDFEKITNGAQELMRISKAAEWTAYKTPQYEVHTNSFRRAVETMIQKAKAKNIDGATLAYVDMTFSCVKCHQHTREERESRLPKLEIDRGLASNR
jgi:cytochrome c556